LRKSRLLADAGALLRVVAPEIEAQLRELVTASGGECLLRGYVEADLDGCGLIIAATDDETLNAQSPAMPIGVACRSMWWTRRPVQRDLPGDRRPLAAGDCGVQRRRCAGAGAADSRQDRNLDSVDLRPTGRSGRAFPQSGQKPVPGCAAASRVLGRRVPGPIADRQLAGQGAEAERLLQAKIDGEADITTGEVYLVGAGPGDPDLLTFRALRLMQQADVVLYDRLVAPAILELCRRDAERVYVGKRRADHAVPQDQINQQLVDLAKARQACGAAEGR
jgi:uroporphyrin-III C-methyltransferase/precorrin-2 dehydrogenase/sirohydrochlorin ferrochelatase